MIFFVSISFTAEELQCLAQWKEGSHHYLVGKLTRERTMIASNEESYRCFIFEKTKTGHGGYTVAMSGDATCTGIASSTEGARTLTFTKVDKGEGKCAFPAWVASHHWHTLDGKMSAKMHHKNSTMHITEDNRRNSSGHYSLSGAGISGLPHGASGSAGILGGIGAVGVVAGTNAGTSGGLFSTSSSSLFTGGTRIVCQSRVDIVEGRHVAIVAKHTQGCKSEEICMHIYQRAKHVTEIQMLRKSDQMSEDFECGKASALGPTLPYVTLVNPEAKSNRCPNLGRYMASGVSTDGRVVRDSCGPMGQGGFHSLIVGCGDRATMEFHSKCANHNPISSYECHGSWEENGTGFLIASSLSRSSTSARRYCFNYQETDEGLRVFSSSESCRRNVSPGIEGVWAFNLTIDGQCAQAVTGSGSSRFKACDLLIAASMISFLTFTSVFQLMLVLQSSPFIRSLRPARTPGAVAVVTASHVANLATSTTAAATSAAVITGMTSRISSLVSR
ncbi:hypothetical protein Ocin01_08532 [Orchesella cincta]|uniref:DUF7042 domain-containing protein n=1 Tax=Orchesella cincta TaxID=48709 RepID=A0A1D2MYM3_ORCCI|nr:hypothetical protein Ocin01_08532 [Orchesella cincta]